MFMQYGVPPMQAYQSKTALVDFLRDNSVQSKKKSKQILDEPINDKPLAEIETCDMDIIDNAEGERRFLLLKYFIFSLLVWQKVNWTILHHHHHHYHWMRIIHWNLRSHLHHQAHLHRPFEKYAILLREKK